MIRRTKKEIALNIAKRIKKPIHFQTAGDQSTYGQSCIAYPDGQINIFNTAACQYFQTKLKSSDNTMVTFDIYMEEQTDLFNAECKKVDAIAYTGSKIDNYI